MASDRRLGSNPALALAQPQGLTHDLRFPPCEDGEPPHPPSTAAAGGVGQVHVPPTPQLSSERGDLTSGHVGGRPGLAHSPMPRWVLMEA